MRFWSRRNRSRGQSLVEFAIMVPVLTLITAGTIDLGRAFYLNIEISGAARQGTRAGILSDTTDIGDAIRQEPNTAIPNTVAAWGNTAQDQGNGCTPGTSANCGDGGGCQPSVFTGSRAACFAIRTCTLTGGAGNNSDLGTCTSFGAWQTRPVPGAGGSGPHGLQVLVVYKLPPVTPFLALMTAGTGGNLYLKSYALADELYF